MVMDNIILIKVQNILYLAIQFFYRDADKSLARPGRKQANELSEWRAFPSAPCLAGKKKLMTARVSMLLKSRASLTCFRACFLPGRAKDLSPPRYNVVIPFAIGYVLIHLYIYIYIYILNF